MSNHHILQLLEERSLPSLRAEELDRITAHTAICQECSSAYEAAQIAFALLQERASVTVEPPPFFQTRVMAAIRARNQSADVWGFARMWQAARTLLGAMAALVVLLTTLTLYSGSNSFSTGTDSSLSYNADASELAIYGLDSFDEQSLTNSQVLSDIYSLEAEGSNGK